MTRFILFFLVMPVALAAQQKKTIATGKAPAPVGPYSQAVKSGKTLYVSGQIALTTEGTMDTLSITAETKRVMENLREILSASKMNFDNIVKTTIFLTDLSNFQQVNIIYAGYFKSDFPARETVEVKALPKGAHIEISMIAVE